jgi:hypothetical protein
MNKSIRGSSAILRHLSCCAPLLALAALPHSRAAASTSFSDATFPDANWSGLKVIDTTAGQTAFFVATQETGGGNPGDYRMTNLDWAYDGVSASQGFRVAELNNTANYTPSTSGAIGSLSFSIDGAIENSSTNSPLSERPVVYQDGSYYFGPQNLLPSGFSTWTSDAVSNLTATDFSDLPGSAHPDFSSAGDPIEFGYSLETFSTPANASASESGFFYGIANDNWSITLTPAVPEPASISIGALVAAALLARRRAD